MGGSLWSFLFFITGLIYTSDESLDSDDWTLFSSEGVLSLKNELTKINPSETAKITDPKIVPHINVGPCAKSIDPASEWLWRPNLVISLDRKSVV